jgi:hypothetical protein
MKAFPNMASQQGMELRDYFAAKAMQLLMPMVSDDPRDVMRLNFDIANMRIRWQTL